MGNGGASCRCGVATSLPRFSEPADAVQKEHGYMLVLHVSQMGHRECGSRRISTCTWGHRGR
eukprot:6460706-Amphidinium_carterae.2